MRRAKLTFGHSGHCQSPSLMPDGGAPGRPPRYGGCVWGLGAASSTKTVFRARFGVCHPCGPVTRGSPVGHGVVAAPVGHAWAVRVSVGAAIAPGRRSRSDCSPFIGFALCPPPAEALASGLCASGVKRVGACEWPPAAKMLLAKRRLRGPTGVSAFWRFCGSQMDHRRFCARASI